MINNIKKSNGTTKKLAMLLLAIFSLLFVACGNDLPYQDEDEIVSSATQTTTYQPSHTVSSEPAGNDHEPFDFSIAYDYNLTQEGVQLAKYFLQDLWRLFYTNVGWRNYQTGELYAQLWTERDDNSWPGSGTNLVPNIPIAKLQEDVTLPLFFANATSHESDWHEGLIFSRIDRWSELSELEGFYNSDGIRLTPPVLTSGRTSEWDGRWINGWTALDATSVYLFDFQGNGIPDILVNFGGWFINYSHVDGVGGSGGAEGVLFSYIDGVFVPVLYVSDFFTDFWRDMQGNMLVRQNPNLYDGTPSHHVPAGFHKIIWNEQGIGVIPVVEVDYWTDLENYERWVAHFWDSETREDIFSNNPTIPGTGEPITQILPLTELTQALIAELSRKILD